MHTLRNALITAALALLATSATAQYEQYTPPGDLPFDEVPSVDRLQNAMAESRWKLGGLRLDPWFGIRDAGWIDNVFATTDGEETSDFTITAGAGLHAYLPLGSKVVVAAHALPEYVWWQDLDERRLWNGRFGLGVFGEFNRLKFEVTATTRREQQNLSAEFESPLNTRGDRVAADLDLRLSGRFSVFAGGSLNAVRYRAEDVGDEFGDVLLGLERDEERLRAGFRYAIGDEFSIGVGVEDSTAEFERVDADRSNTGFSPMLEVSYSNPRLRFDLVLIAADIEPDGPTSQFTKFSDPLGRFQLRFVPGARLEIQLYGQNNLVYSLETASPYFEDQRYGVGALYPLSPRMGLRAYGESGEIRYGQPAEQGLAPAEDRDVTTYGLQFTYEIAEDARLYATASQTDQEAASGFTTSYTAVRIGVLLGQGPTDWW